MEQNKRGFDLRAILIYFATKGRNYFYYCLKLWLAKMLLLIHDITLNYLYCCVIFK